MGNRASSNSSEGNAGFDPSDVYIYRGEGRIPRNVRWVEVHRSVKFIPDRLFQSCDELESVLLHEGLLRVGKYAFSWCSSLRSIQIPSTVTGIGAHAFYACSSLEEVELPEGLESIGDYAFFQCTSLGEARIPASVVRIGAHAFNGCTNLASLDLRAGLWMIGDFAFRGCRSLESLCVPSSVLEIGACAFDRCSSLTLVQLHEGLMTMKKFAFRGCPPESFRFVRLSERREAISMGDQMTSMFESRLNEIANAMTRNYDGWRVADAIWGKCKKSLERANEFLDFLELKGAMPVLELAFWKAKIEGEGDDQLRGDLADDEDGGRDARDTAEVIESSRDSQLYRKDCRVTCRADIVSAEAQKFFAYKTSWPRLNDLE